MQRSVCLVLLYRVLPFLFLPVGANSSCDDHHLRGCNGHSSRQTIETRIVGGDEADLGSHPSYVQWTNGCAGILIHDDFVLTAAHCNSVTNAIQRYALYVGGNGQANSGTRMFATAAFQHPRYDAGSAFLYDFLILKLPRRIQGVPFATLNSNQSYPTNEAPLTVVGHGLLDSQDSRDSGPTIYHEVTVPYIESCTRYFSQVEPEVQFCAGDMPWGGRDSCIGDSGSGIFDEDGLLVGIVSWGIGCARPFRPGVYARVSAVERWVAHMICQESAYPPADCTNVQVNIKVDDHPEEIGLSLLDYDNAYAPEAIVLPPGSLNANPQQTLRYRFSVPKGRNYLLQVEDTAQNGFCCEDGAGEVNVRDGQNRYHLSGLFQSRYASILLPRVGERESEKESEDERTHHWISTTPRTKMAP